MSRYKWWARRVRVVFSEFGRPVYANGRRGGMWAANYEQLNRNNRSGGKPLMKGKYASSREPDPEIKSNQ